MVALGEYDVVQTRVAAAIHNNHGAPPGDVTCFMCRRDATKVLQELHALGYGIVRRPVATATPALPVVLAAPIP